MKTQRQLTQEHLTSLAEFIHWTGHDGRSATRGIVEQGADAADALARSVAVQLGLTYDTSTPGDCYCETCDKATR